LQAGYKNIASTFKTKDELSKESDSIKTATKNKSAKKQSAEVSTKGSSNAK